MKVWFVSEAFGAAALRAFASEATAKACAKNDGLMHDPSPVEVACVKAVGDKFFANSKKEGGNRVSDGIAGTYADEAGAGAASAAAKKAKAKSRLFTESLMLEA